MLSVFTKMNSGIEERHHGPSDALHNPSQPFKVILFSIHSDDGNPSRAIIKQALRYQDYQDKDCQGRLLASFQDDAKYEHVGQDTRSQDSNDDKEKTRKRFKDLRTKDKVERQ
ncbi:hypothetical protein Tco_1182032 [Tanacetum coccineum]